jgi:AraC-like DNA-binding protein
MQHFKTIKAYCEGIGISAPRHPHFDIRSFEENMRSVKQSMPAFRHEFYAIAIKADGDGKAITGAFTDFPEGTSLFFNTPFQLISWDILPNWKGYYIMFSPDFISQSKVLSALLDHFPFLKMDQAIPFTLPKEQLEKIQSIYEGIWEEYKGEAQDKFQLIEAQVYLLLVHVKRLFETQVDEDLARHSLRSADLKLFSRYRTLIETQFYPDSALSPHAKLHSTRYYAELLSVHPNHLNAVSKEISGLNALKHIHNHLLALAKTYLVQTEWSVKEVAYSLYFDSPKNFSAFFKKNTSLTPLEFRSSMQ